MKSFMKTGVLLAPIFFGVAGCDSQVPQDQAYCVKQDSEHYNVVVAQDNNFDIANLTTSNTNPDGTLNATWVPSNAASSTGTIDLKAGTCAIYRGGFGDYVYKIKSPTTAP